MGKTDSPIQFYGASWCPDCQRSKQLLGRYQVAYDYIDIEQDAAAAQRVAELNNGRRATPTIVLPDQTVLTEPTDAELLKALGLGEAAAKDFQDLIIVGAGPAGLSAAIYTTREDINTVLFEAKAVGGQAGVTELIDNYPGFASGVGGLELAEQMEQQARRFGAVIKLGESVTGIKRDGQYLAVSTTGGEHITKSVLITTGSDYRKLGVPGEQQYTGKGVHYCATCDGPFYRGKHLAVIGGGNSAMQEGIFLTKFAEKVTLIVRGDRLKGSEILIDKVKSMPQIEIHYGVTTTAIIGNETAVTAVQGVSQQGKTVDFKVDGVFVYIGLLPNTNWLKGVLELDEHGFIITDKSFETNLPGVFAAGDVRAGSTLQIASAVGEGVTAALMIREYLKKTG